MGYDPVAGGRIFMVLCEALSRKGLLGIGNGVTASTKATSSASAAAEKPPVKGNTALVAAFASEEEEILTLNR